MNVLSWICRQIWAYAVRGAIAAAWLVGGWVGNGAPSLRDCPVRATWDGQRDRPVRRPVAVSELRAEESNDFDEPEEPEPIPQQRAIERAQYRKRRIAELQQNPSLLVAGMDDWCREDIEASEIRHL